MDSRSFWLFPGLLSLFATCSEGLLAKSSGLGAASESLSFSLVCLAVAWVVFGKGLGKLAGEFGLKRALKICAVANMALVGFLAIRSKAGVEFGEGDFSPIRMAQGALAVPIFAFTALFTIKINRNLSRGYAAILVNLAAGTGLMVASYLSSLGESDGRWRFAFLAFAAFGSFCYLMGTRARSEDRYEPSVFSFANLKREKASAFALGAGCVSAILNAGFYVDRFVRDTLVMEESWGELNSARFRGWALAAFIPAAFFREKTGDVFTAKIGAIGMIATIFGAYSLPLERFSTLCAAAAYVFFLALFFMAFHGLFFESCRRSSGYEAPFAWFAAGFMANAAICLAVRDLWGLSPGGAGILGHVPGLVVFLVCLVKNGANEGLYRLSFPVSFGKHFTFKRWHASAKIDFKSPTVRFKR